jgi:hypothetical protein
MKGNQPSMSPPKSSATVGPTATLTDEQIERIAERIANLLREPMRPRLVDATALARELGVSRDFVYAHATELGGARIGHGSRGRLRFDRERALAAWSGRACHRTKSRLRPACSSVRRRRRQGHDPGLLPVRRAEITTNAAEETRS